MEKMAITNLRPNMESLIDSNWIKEMLDIQGGNLGYK